MFPTEDCEISAGSKSLGLLLTTSSVWLHLQLVGLAKMILFEFLEDFFFPLFDKTLWNLKTSEAVLKA